MDEFERTIVELEAIFTDPELDKILAYSRDVNSIIKDEPTTTLDAYKIVNELERDWQTKGFKNKEMFVTGSVYVGGNYQLVTDTSSMDDCKVDLVNMPFKAQGFSMLNILKDVDPTTNTLVYDQRLVLWGFMEFADKNGVDGVSIENCGIIIDENVLIECKEMTPAKVSAWLEVYETDTKRSIDEVLVNAENEAEATLQLKDVAFPIAKMRRKARKEHQGYLEEYLNHTNRYEQYIPYLAELIGDCEIYYQHDGGWKDNVITSQRKTILVINRLFLRINHDKTAFIPWIEGIIVGSDKKQGRLVRLPLETIDSIESGKDILKRS